MKVRHYFHAVATADHSLKARPRRMISEIPKLLIVNGRTNFLLASLALTCFMNGYSQNANLDFITSLETTLRYQKFVVSIRPFEYLVSSKTLFTDDFVGYHLDSLNVDLFAAFRSDSKGRLYTGCRFDKRITLLDNKLRTLFRLEGWNGLNAISKNVVLFSTSSAYDFGPTAIGFLYIFQASEKSTPRHYIGPSLNVKMQYHLNLYLTMTKEIFGPKYFALARLSFSLKP
jgi:hypothetical protein